MSGQRRGRRRRELQGRQRRLIVARRTALAAGSMSILLAAGDARATLSYEHQPAVDGCTEAATYFPEDDSPEARRARIRCRRETFAQRLEDEREQDEAVRDQEIDKNVESWLNKQEIPVRVMRRNSVDLFGSGGLASYGVAVGWLLFPALEAEVWLGRRNVAASFFNATMAGYMQDSRTCVGGRFKWMMRSRGNLTPFASIGAADCWANVRYDPYNSGPIFPGDNNPQPQNSAAGTAAAHVATGSVGLAWMEKSGLRASLEYMLDYAFYSQATLDDQARTQDANLHAAWDERLSGDRKGFRIQVGYAF
jgi:hypothetical protein